MFNIKMVSEFEKVISNAIYIGGNKIKINIKKTSCFIEVFIDNKKIQTDKIDDGLSFAETIFFLLQNRRANFDPKIVQFGKVHYEIKNISKTITYKSIPSFLDDFCVIYNTI